MRNGRAKATTPCMKPSWPMASPTPSVECIMNDHQDDADPLGGFDPGNPAALGLLGGSHILRHGSGAPHAGDVRDEGAFRSEEKPRSAAMPRRKANTVRVKAA